RSYYFANAYEYPVAVFTLPDGSQALVHCPDSYNKLEIEELESGRRLTTRDGKSIDFFHSRLQISPGGKYLLSAGWIWHPIDLVQLYCISNVLDDPRVLDQSCKFDFSEWPWDVRSACFQSDDVLLLTGESADSKTAGHYLGVYNLQQQQMLH